MANTYTLIASYTFASDAASYTFNSIPNTYTDLQLLWTWRNTLDGGSTIRFNGSTSNYQYRSIFSTGNTGGTPATTYGGNVTNGLILQYFANSGTTFNYGANYITNYASATRKSIWTDNVRPNISSATDYSVIPMSHNWSDTATISSLTVAPGSGSIASGSKFWLYGIKTS